jgi:hypothetical protein
MGHRKEHFGERTRFRVSCDIPESLQSPTLRRYEIALLIIDVKGRSILLGGRKFLKA